MTIFPTKSQAKGRNKMRVEHQAAESTCTVDMVGNDVVDLFAVESKGTQRLRKE